MGFKVGEPVRIKLPEKTKKKQVDVCQTLREYDGADAIVKRVQTVHDYKGLPYKYYELYDITGLGGIPLAFLGEWLRAI